MKAYLTVYSPSGEEYEKYYFSTMIEASPQKRSIIIGRKDEDGKFDRETDIKLPSEERLISRKHLLIESRDEVYCWVKDLDSTHPALLRKATTSSNGDNIFTVEGETPHRLENGDRLLLQSKFPVEGSPEWVLSFSDPDQTDVSRDVYPSRNKYEYDLSSKILYLRTAVSQLQRIQFTGQRLKIVDYIAQKVKEEGDLYVVPYKELISELWPGEKSYARTLDNLRPPISGINKEISQRWGDDAPKLIDSVHSHGYRLNNCVVRQKEVQELLTEKDSRISNLENMIKRALQIQNLYVQTYTHQGDLISQDPKKYIKNDLQGATFGGRLVDAEEQRQSLTDAAAEIQQLLQQLEQSYPNATAFEKQSALTLTLQQEIKQNPKFRTRLKNALKEVGLEALKVLFAPIGIPLEMVRGWIEAEAE